MANERRYDPISFSGANTTYRAGTVSNYGNGLEGDNSGTSPVGEGFYDIAYVKELFRIMRGHIGTIMSTLETDLGNYMYIVEESDEITLSAIKAIAKSLDVDSLSSYVHYRLYKHLLKNGDSNASTYLINLYESKLRNASGSISLDLLKLILFISNEMTRMEEFIDEFIGELDDTSEYRIIETFQNWGEDAYNTLTTILETSQKKNRTELPVSELDKLDKSKGSGVQALFKVKINAGNLRLQSTFAEMYRDLTATADTFYRNYLGKSLKFRLKISRDLGTGVTTPILQQEINNTISGLDSNFAVHLADLYKRATTFRANATEILGIVTARDSYNYYIEQLAAKGTKVKKEFTTVVIPSEELALLEDVDFVKDFRSVKNYEATFMSSHSVLEDLDDDDAHPQYLLKSGGTLTGDLELADDVRVGGIIPKLHKHNGLDGSAKIAGGDIEFNTITDTNIDTSPSETGIPFNMILSSAVPIVGAGGISSVTVQIRFDIEDDNVAGYEFEIIELS